MLIYWPLTLFILTLCSKLNDLYMTGPMYVSMVVRISMLNSQNSSNRSLTGYLHICWVSPHAWSLIQAGDIFQRIQAIQAYIEAICFCGVESPSLEMSEEIVYWSFAYFKETSDILNGKQRLVHNIWNEIWCMWWKCGIEMELKWKRF